MSDVSNVPDRAAKWMTGIGLLHLAMMLLCFGGGAAAAIHSAKHGGDWQGVGYLFGFAAAIVGLWYLAFAVVLLLARPGVQRGFRRATNLSIIATVLAMVMPLPVTLFIWLSRGTSPTFATIMTVLWLTPHARLIRLLFRVRASVSPRNA